nr:uncharacterized protein LOC120967255 [Aegilops tauschii subsp. strangulata]
MASSGYKHPSEALDSEHRFHHHNDRHRSTEIDNGALGNSSKGKEVAAGKKGKAMVELGSAPKRPKNYGHLHEGGSTSHFCKVILAPMLECMSMPVEFTKRLTTVRAEDENQLRLEGDGSNDQQQGSPRVGPLRRCSPDGDRVPLHL